MLEPNSRKNFSLTGVTEKLASGHPIRDPCQNRGFIGPSSEAPEKKTACHTLQCGSLSRYRGAPHLSLLQLNPS